MRRIAITLGDPAGIGPEIVLKACHHFAPDGVEWVVYGSAPVLTWTRQQMPSLPALRAQLVDVLPHAPIDFAFGHPSATCAHVQHGALVKAIADCRSGGVDAIVTAPWTKYILPLAQLPATGHTEVLGDHCGVAHPTMLLCGDRLRVALATIHIPLADVATRLNRADIVIHLHQLSEGLRRWFGIEKPVIAVAGLNPHAGEGGIMGTEEQTIIAPAIADAVQAGVDAEGPFPADTLFARAVHQPRWDAILAMYHDQGLGPLKLWHWREAANVTLGLPLIRTSVDHGTAYDIAGQNRADADSLIYAMKLALKMADNARAGGGQ